MSRHDEMAARFARYCELRDSRLGRIEAAGEVGLDPYIREGAAVRYERAYRRMRGITPPRGFSTVNAGSAS